MSIKLENLDAIVKRIEGLADSSNIESSLGKAAAIVEASAKKKAPKGDGSLRNSITSKVDGDKAIVFTPLEYAPYVEYGTGLFAEDGGRTDVPWNYKDEEGNWHSTSGMKPRPYMRPALNDNRNKIISIIKEGLLND